MSQKGNEGSAFTITVDRNEYFQLQATVEDLQIRYNALLADKRRWRDYAVLSSASQMVAVRDFTLPFAIKTARELLTLIEGTPDNDATQPGPDPGR